MKKESLSDEEREALLRELRSYLPAFLKRSAIEQPDPAGDVRELLSLEQDDLDRVVAVHQCLAPEVLRFGEALEVGLKHPFSQQARVATASQAIRGSLDWAATARHRARVPGDRAWFQVRQSGSSAFAIDENRAVAWLLDRLEEIVDRAAFWSKTKSAGNPSDRGWSGKIDDLRASLAAARQVPWLEGLTGRRPDARVLGSLRAARDGFYARILPAAIESVMRLSEPSSQVLTAVLSERYFRPDDDGTLFEVAIALRLAKAFEDLSPERRKTRLLMGDGRSSFARFAFGDGSQVSIAYQAWPDGRETMRRTFVRRHKIGKRPKDSIPDLILIRHRQDGSADALILELKASSDASYLRQGLAELLAYLADRPDLWADDPVAWLVAPASGAFEAAEADPSFPIWVVDGDLVAAAATARFVASVVPTEEPG